MDPNDEPDTATQQEAATDNVETSEDDNSDEYAFLNLDEDQDTEEAVETEETDDDDETVEEEAQDDQEAETETEDQTDDENPDKVSVKMDDGESLTVSELKKGYLRQSDYTRKQQEVANVRKAVATDAQRMQSITEVFVDHLSSLVPDAPDASLALSDPNAYTAQKAQHEAAMAQVQKLIELGEAPKKITQEMSESDQKEAFQRANEQLVQMFPEAAGGETRKAFFDNIGSVATELGFTNAELSQTTDPRIFALAHWAKKGMAADKAKAVSKAKVAKAPPSTPRKPGQGATKPDGKKRAMQNLLKDDSIENAVRALSG